ncbi:MAG: hypothetical protein ACI841_003395 [Planctomycetota bacterium]|jgi:hypothetical protein
MNRIILALPILPALAGAMIADLAQAGELEPRMLPEKTRFVAHVDFEALVRMKAFRAIEEHVLEDLDADEEFMQEMTRLGIDFRKDLKSATVFGEDEEHGTVVFVTSDKLDTALDRARDEVQFHKHSVDGLELISVDDADDGFMYVMSRNEGSERVVFASDNARSVVQAVRVYQGKARSLADASEPAISANPAKNSVLFVSAGGLDSLSDLGPASHIASKASSFVLDLGERSALMFLRLSAQTNSPKDAKDLKAIVDGLRAIMTLTGGDDLPEFVMELMNSVQLEVLGSEVILSIELDVTDMLEQIEDLQEF